MPLKVLRLPPHLIKDPQFYLHQPLLHENYNTHSPDHKLNKVYTVFLGRIVSKSIANSSATWSGVYVDGICTPNCASDL